MAGGPRRTLYIRFYEKVALPDENGCMLWLGMKTKDGYGRFLYKGAIRTAGNVALRLAGEPQTEDRTHAAHSCRNRHCVALAHLRWATDAENAADRKRDGTETIGELHGQSKLTADAVRAMRREYAAGGTSFARLAEAYGLRGTAVRNAVRGATWGHIPGAVA